MNRSSNPANPTQYTTEHGALDDVAIPAMLRPLCTPAPEAPPPAARATGTEARVCADIARRQWLGLAKYGVSVEGNPLALRQWLQHAYEEALDFAIYLRRNIEELQRQEAQQQQNQQHQQHQQHPTIEDRQA